MKKDLIAEITARAIVAALFVAVTVWFVTLIPGAIDRELDNTAAKVAAHLEMLNR